MRHAWYYGQDCRTTSFSSWQRTARVAGDRFRAATIIHTYVYNYTVAHDVIRNGISVGCGGDRGFFSPGAALRAGHFFTRSLQRRFDNFG